MDHRPGNCFSIALLRRVIYIGAEPQLPIAMEGSSQAHRMCCEWTQLPGS